MKLAAHPESFQLERAGPRIFVNVPNAESHRRGRPCQHEGRGDVAGLGGQSPISPWRSTRPGHRLFVGCRRPAKVLVYDTASGHPLGSFDIVGDTDDVFYDPQTERLFVTGGDGFVDVFDVAAPDRSPRIAHVATAAGARTSLYVADQKRLYVAVPHRGAQAAEIRIFEAR